MLATHQESVQPVHLQAYLGEFCFLFNLRNSRKRGILFYRLFEQSVEAPPVWCLVKFRVDCGSKVPLRDT